ncbi:MAG: flagellar hook-basal body complex protein FliE [Gammaproteobacteria bacterium]|nr:flagellar hook-basal body complex protein FliE [Gammaproteobacteria bacterium]
MSDIKIDQMLSQMKSIQAMAQGQHLQASKTTETQPAFLNMLNKAVDQVNSTQQTAGNLATQFEAGNKNVDLVEVMVALQKSRVSFQALVEVRNKLLSAYQDVMNMQV